MVIIDPQDLTGAIQAVAILAEDPQTRKQLGDRALAFYQTSLSWETISKRFLEVIASVRMQEAGPVSQWTH
jgi:glycosyltransferase involved in cell wall biosynthesis